MFGLTSTAEHEVFLVYLNRSASEMRLQIDDDAPDADAWEPLAIGVP